MDGYFTPAFGQHQDRGNKKVWIVGMRTWPRAQPTWKPSAQDHCAHQPGAQDGFTLPHAWRELAHEMAGLVTSIFNNSIELGEAPSDWRIANAMPIFKSGGRREGEKVRQARIGL